MATGFSHSSLWACIWFSVLGVDVAESLVVQLETRNPLGRIRVIIQFFIVPTRSYSCLADDTTDGANASNHLRDNLMLRFIVWFLATIHPSVSGVELRDS